MIAPHLPLMSLPIEFSGAQNEIKEIQSALREIERIYNLLILELETMINRMREDEDKRVPS